MSDSFSASFQHLHLLSHPFYQAWMAGTLPPTVLPDYAAQYYHHVDRFPRYLSAIHSQCEDSGARLRLLQNLNDEEGLGYPASHPELWLRFAEGVGASRETVATTEPRAAIRRVSATFFELSRSSYHEGLGALFAYESQVPEIAASKIEGLRTRFGIDDARTLEFFEVHRTADVEHREEILAMLEALPEEQKVEARAACQKAAAALWDFLSEVHADA